MFSGKDILRSAVFVAIGGIAALLVSKLLKGNEGEAAQGDMGEIREEDELNAAERPKKQPVEHDVRACEGECDCSHY